METTSWILELLGRLHPLMIHFPIGLLIGVCLLEIWNRWKNAQADYSAFIYLGAGTAMLSAFMGFWLMDTGDYTGNLITQHQWMGYATALFTFITAVMYTYRDQLPTYVPLTALCVSCIVLTVTGHLGASLTHGKDYLTEVLPWNKNNEITTEELQALLVYANEDTFPSDQLDALNLKVRAIFAHNCYQCHSTEKRKGDLALDHPEGVFAGGEHGPVITVGQSEESEIIRRLLLPRSHDDAMPPKGKSLTSEEIEIVKLWIDSGAHWADETLKVFREAELALESPNLPQQLSDQRLTHPIDQFVDQYFSEHKIQWPDPIKDRPFIRRAYLDIIGLLPSPEAIEQFERDPSPDKRAQLIYRLLDNNEEYVLHWLSFWNDLLRNDYSGTGFITGGRKQISHWLYESLYTNKPYDQLVEELINPTPESEGFIKGIQWRGVVNASQRTELQAAQNISQSLLGLNLKCASCHNSFVNNLSLDQAYSFANIFAESDLEIFRCDKPTGRIATTAFLYPELGEVNGESIKERLKELSSVMIKPENGRLYRTIVNRFWDQLLGRGLVAPVDEMDRLPWNQELLDWLAADFRANGYDLKYLLAYIMTSRTYQLPGFSYPSPEYMASESFVFRGPAIRRLTAEQFIDAFAQVVTPVYFGVAFDPDDRHMEAKWIWHEEVKLDRRVLPDPGTRLFRKSFTLTHHRPLLSAKVLMTADHAYNFYLNGQHMGEGSDWREIEQWDVPASLLQKENIIAIAGKNEGDIPNPAGLLFSLQLLYEDSTLQYIHSDQSWKTSKDTLAQEWTQLIYDDSTWEDAWRAGSFQRSYWGSIPSFRFDKDSISTNMIRASLVRQDAFMKSLGRPVRENVTTQRNAEATLLQSLMLTNSQFFHEAIARGADEWKQLKGDHPKSLLTALFLKVLGRAPTNEELTLLLPKLESDSSLESLQDIIWTLVLLPEFQLI